MTYSAAANAGGGQMEISVGAPQLVVKLGQPGEVTAVRVRYRDQTLELKLKPGESVRLNGALGKS
jgi:hypothetical protein